MPLWKATLAYDGTTYNGWQIQPHLPTVQGSLAEAIQRVTGESVLPQGSGRTDTGVHALAQVASFSLTVPIPPANLHRALNRALPSSIRILAIEPATEDFHARHSALRKTYEYRIFPRVPSPPAILPGASGTTDRICSPILARYVWDCPLPLDFATLQNAADHIRGTHDFTSFAASDPDQTTRTTTSTRTTASIRTTEHLCHSERSEEPPHLLLPLHLPLPVHPQTSDTPSIPPHIRTIHHSAWHQHDGLYIYRITGNGFLHHMVRNLVGTFVEAATKRISADDIPTILAARNRSAAGPTAPARGLFLVEVEY